MKTTQKKNGLPIMQTTVRGISDKSPSTSLSSTERSRKRRKTIYSNKSLFMGLKKKDSLRKKLKAVEKCYEEERRSRRSRKIQKEREEKCKQRLERKKAKEAAAQKLATPVKRKVKNIEQKLRKKYMKLSEEKSCKKGTSSSQVTPQNSKLIVSKAIWNHMLPKSKYKMVRSLKVSPEIPKGLNRAIGMEIGLIFPTLMKSARKMRHFSNEKGYSLNAKRWQEHFQTQRKWYLILLKRERKYLPGTA